MSTFSDGLDSTYAKVSRRLVPVLVIAYIVAYLDRVNVSFAKLQMLEDLGFSETIYGLGAGIFFIGYFLFGVPANMLLHRVGARRLLCWIMVAWSLVSAATMFVRSPLEFYVLRFLLGLAEAGFFPGVILYLTQWYPPDRRAKVTALFMTGIAICSTFGSVLSGWILQTFDGYHGWAGWQWLFLLEALPALILGLYIGRSLSDSIVKAPWLDDEEKRALTQNLQVASAAVRTGSFSTAFRDGRVWLACLIYFCVITGLYGLSFWLPTIIHDMGVSQPLHVGLLTAVPYAVAAVGMVLVGRSADRHKESRWHFAIPLSLGALGLIASVLLNGHPVGVMAALVLATFGILTAAPLFWPIPTSYLSGAAAAAGIGIINSIGNLAGFASPYVVGRIKDVTHSTAWGLYWIAAFVLLGAILTIAFVPRRTPSKK